MYCVVTRPPCMYIATRIFAFNNFSLQTVVNSAYTNSHISVYLPCYQVTRTENICRYYSPYVYSYGRVKDRREHDTTSNSFNSALTPVVTMSIWQALEHPTSALWQELVQIWTWHTHKNETGFLSRCSNFLSSEKLHAAELTKVKNNNLVHH